jgi:hypothetical protein
MRSIITLLLMVTSGIAQAQGSAPSNQSNALVGGKPCPNCSLLSLDHFSLTYQEFDNRRDAYVPSIENWKYRATANFDLSLLGFLYWDNKVHTEGIDSGAVKTVGWHWFTGARLTGWLDLFKEHHSYHVMEEQAPEDIGRFPVEDSIGIRVRFIDNPNNRRPIFR